MAADKSPLPNEHLSLLYHLAQTFNSSLDLNEVQSLVMDEVITAFNADRGFVVLKNNDGKIEFKAPRGIDRKCIRSPQHEVSRSLIEKVIVEGKPILSLADQKDQRLDEGKKTARYNLQAVMCVPLKTKDETFGAIYLDSAKQTGTFSDADLALLSSIAGHAAMAIEKASLFEEAQSNLETVHLLHDISIGLTSSLDHNQVLEDCLNRVQESLQAETGLIMMTDGNELVFQVAVGEKANEIKPFRVPLGKGIAGWVVENSAGEIVNDVEKDPRIFPEADAVPGYHTRELMAAPLIVNERTIGVIEVINKPGGFRTADLELLTTIAGSAAIALENAGLFQEVQTNLESLRLLHDISTDLTSTLDINKVLTGCLNRVQDKLGTATCSIMTVERDELVFRVALDEQDRNIKPFQFPLGAGIAGWVVENSRGVIVNDVSKDTRFYPEVDAVSGFVTKAVLAAPLIVNEQVIGVVEALNKPEGFTDADLALLTTIAGGTAIALDNARLFQVAVEKGRMERELQMARNVQTKLIPEEIPEIPGWEFAVRWIPAREVSGDYYDFIHADHGKLGFLIADVTDKGMPAALFMAFCRSIIRANIIKSATPAEAITQANHLICADSTSDMPLSMFFGKLESGSGEITFVNAGHNPPLLVRAGKNTISELTRTGKLMGFDPKTTYEQTSVELNPGDFIVLYTDGVCDAINAKEQEFGENRLKKLVQKQTSASPGEIIIDIEKSVNDFIGTTTPFDDITIMVVKKI